MLINDNKIICEMKHLTDAMVEFPLNDSFFVEDFTPTYVLGDDNAPGTIFRARPQFDGYVVQFVPVKGIKPGDEVDVSSEDMLNSSLSDFQIKFGKKESLKTFIDFLEGFYDFIK